MSVFPGGYSDPSNKTLYGSSAYPPGPATYTPGQPQQPLQYGANVSTQPAIQFNINPAVFVAMQASMAPANSEFPVQMKCPFCQAQITTTTKYVPGMYTYFWCIWLSFMGLIPFAWVPFVTDCARDVVHTCPSCNAECGLFRRRIK